MTIDALVSIVSLQNSESDEGLIDGRLRRLDSGTSRDMDIAFRNSAPDGTKGFFIFEVQFVIGGTNNPVILRNVTITAEDVDSNQFVQFSGLRSYRLSNTRDLNVRADDVLAYPAGVRSLPISGGGWGEITVPSGSVLFYARDSSESNDVKHHVEAYYSEITSLRIMLGSFRNAAAGFALDFRPSGAFASGATSSFEVNPPAYTKSYNLNEGFGSVPDSVTGVGALTVGGNLSTPAINRSGFEFAGWNTRADGAGVSYLPGNSLLPVTDVVLFAVWTPVFTKSYDLNLGTGITPVNVIGRNAQTVLGSLSAPGFSRSGFVFSGWNTQADGRGISYEPGSSLMLSSDTTLYAVWTPVFTKFYDANGGLGSPSNSVIGVGPQTVLLPLGLLEVTRIGHVFKGWNTQADGLGVDFQPGETFFLVQDSTLFAMWYPAPNGDSSAVVDSIPAPLTPVTTTAITPSFSPISLAATGASQSLPMLFVLLLLTLSLGGLLLGARKKG